MSEDVPAAAPPASDEVHLTGILVSKDKPGKGYVDVAGTVYKYADWVEPYLARQAVGSSVDIIYKQHRNGGRTLISIRKSKTAGGETPAAAASPAKEKAGFKTSSEVKKDLSKMKTGVLVKVLNGNAHVYHGEKTRVLCLTPSDFSRIMADPMLDPPQEIGFALDTHNFITAFALGPSVELPPGAGEIGQNKEAKASLDALTGPPLAPASSAPAQQQEKTIPASTSPSPSPSAATVPAAKTLVIPPPASRITIDTTINLGGYESLKIGINGEATDHAALKAYLIDTLRQYGQRDPMTREAIDRYIHRVLLPPAQGVQE